MKFRHTMLRVYDIDKALEFYQNILGLEILKTREVKDAMLYYLGDNPEKHCLVLCYNFGHYEKYTHGNHFGHLGFTVNSIDEFTQKLKSLNYDYEREPFNTNDGFKLAFIKDPDGYYIELVEEL